MIKLYKFKYSICVSNYVIILFILLFSGCSKSNEENKIITFWGMGSEGEYIKKLIPEFEKDFSNVKVKVQMIPWTAAQEKLISAYASDNLPDVFQLGNTWIPQFVALKAIEELDKSIKNSNVISDTNYFKGIWETNRINNNIYGIPWYIDTRLLFYRTDILAKAGYKSPPKTWSQFYDVSLKIRNNFKDKDKYAVYLPTNEWAPFVIFGLQTGAQILRDQNCYGNFSGEKFKRAFNFLINFHKKKLAPIGISQVNNVYQAFADEYFSMYISGPWNVNEFKKWMSGDLSDKWMTAPLPCPDNLAAGDSIGLSLAGGASLVLNNKSANKIAAWKFIEFLSKKSTQLKFYKLANSLPAVKQAWQDSTLRNDKYMKAFFKQFQHVTETPKIPEWEQIAFSKIQQYAELAARNVLTTDEALEKLDKDVNIILEKRRWLLGKEK